MHELACVHTTSIAAFKQLRPCTTSLESNATFSQDDFSYEQVFGHLTRQPLSATEAAEYLGISLPTLRRYVQAGKLLSSHIVGRKKIFSVIDLRAYKRNRDSNST